MTGTTPHHLLALVACSDEWMCRSLESVFAEKRYKVTRTGSGKQALKLARRSGYDVLILDERMDELTGGEVCVALRGDPLFDDATPRVITGSSHPTSPSRTAATPAAACQL